MQVKRAFKSYLFLSPKSNKKQTGPASIFFFQLSLHTCRQQMCKPSISKSTSPCSVALSFSKNISFGENLKTHGDQITGKRICESERRFYSCCHRFLPSRPRQREIIRLPESVFSTVYSHQQKGGRKL